MPSTTRRWLIRAATFVLSLTFMLSFAALIPTTGVYTPQAKLGPISYVAIAYSMANSTPYFAFADTKAAAEADALNACYPAGASDCNVPSGGSGWEALSSMAGKAIAWSFQQLGSGLWNEQCEAFVEHAYGNYGSTGRYLTSQDAFVLHTSTNWSPDVGALVFFNTLSIYYKW